MTREEWIAKMQKASEECCKGEMTPDEFNAIFEEVSLHLN